MNKISGFIPSLLVAVAIVVLGLCLKAGIDGFSHRDRAVTVRDLCGKKSWQTK